MNLKTLAAGMAVIALLGGCATSTGGILVPYTDEISAFDPITDDPASIDTDYPPAITSLSFDSDGARLNGVLCQADGPGPHPTLVLLHGYPGNEKTLDVAQTVRRAGFNVMLFHYRGSWGSGGAFGFEHVVEDAGAAIDFLRETAADHRVDPDRISTLGHSLGGHASLHAGARDKGVICVGGLAAADFGLMAGAVAADPDMAAGFSAATDELMDGPLDGMSGAAALAELGERGASFALAPLASELVGRSVLLVAGAQDEVLSPEAFHDPLVGAYSAEPGLKLTAATLPGDHSFSWTRIALTRVALDWLNADCR